MKAYFWTRQGPGRIALAPTQRRCRHRTRACADGTRGAWQVGGLPPALTEFQKEAVL